MYKCLDHLHHPHRSNGLPNSGALIAKITNVGRIVEVTSNRFICLKLPRPMILLWADRSMPARDLRGPIDLNEKYVSSGPAVKNTASLICLTSVLGNFLKDIHFNNYPGLCMSLLGITMSFTCRMIEVLWTFGTQQGDTIYPHL